MSSKGHRRPSPELCKRDEKKSRQLYQNMHLIHNKQNCISHVNSDSENNEIDVRENYRKNQMKVFNIKHNKKEQDILTNLSTSRKNNQVTKTRPSPLDYCFKNELEKDYG